MHNKNTLISLRNVSVEFDGTRVLDKINLDIGDKNSLHSSARRAVVRQLLYALSEDLSNPQRVMFFLTDRKLTDSRLIRGT